MRKNLIDARKKLWLTQTMMAEKLGVCQQYYSAVERGCTTGNVRLWDAIEDILGANQRVLRENF